MIGVPVVVEVEEEVMFWGLGSDNFEMQNDKVGKERRRRRRRRGRGLNNNSRGRREREKEKVN